MATYYSYDDIHRIDAWQDNNITLMLTQGEGLDGEIGSNTYVKRPTFQLKDERGIISIPTTGVRLELAFTRKDGTTGSLSSNEITSYDGEKGIVSFTVKPNLTSVTGIVKGEIRLITSNAVIKFYGVNFWVNKGVSNQDAIESEDFDSLIKAMQELTLITPEGVAILDTLDENGELPTNGAHPVASGVLKEYLKGNYVRSESVNDSAIDTANDQRTIYIHNVGGSVSGVVLFIGHNNYEEVTTVIQYRFCKGGKIEFRTGTVKSPVTIPNTYIWDKTYNENWNPIGGKGVFVINEETVPESAQWDDEIPATYAGQTGEEGELVLWLGTLWYLYNVAMFEQTTYYNWDKVATTEDLEAKMALAPLNPTAEQIAALPSGQLYSDTANHKGAIKGGQEFYDTDYINRNYRKTIISEDRPPIGAPAGTDENIIRTGDVWVESEGKIYQCVYTLYNFSPVPASIPPQHYYYWKPLNNVVINSYVSPPSNVVHERITYTIDGVTFSWFPFSEYYLDDVYHDVGANKKYMLANEPSGSIDGEHETYYYTWQEADYYTKTEINNMIGDIGTRLDQVRGVSNE